MKGERDSHLPNSWEHVPLHKIAAVNPTLDKSAYQDDLPVSFVPMPAMEAGTGIVDVSETRTFGQLKKGYTPFQEGDVLFAKITPCMENGKMAVAPPMANGLGFGSTEFHVLRPYGGISAPYIYYFVSSLSFRRDAEHHMTGAVGQRRVPTRYLAEQVIPLAPSLEQDRIVTKIEELFSELENGAANLQRARNQLQVYRQALLKNAFEGKLTADWRDDRAGNGGTPWCAVELGDVLSFVTSGSRGWAAYYAAEGDIFIRAQNLKHDRLELDDVAYIELPEGKATEGTRTRVQLGDVLVTITGANVTKTGLVDRDLGTAYVSQHVALVRPTDALSPRFLYWYLLSETGGRRQLADAAYGAGKPGLNLGNIKTVSIPLPSVSEQNDIVQRLEEKLSLADRLEQEIASALGMLPTLRSAILNRAFAGKLSAQQPTDESASTLLERIASENGRAAQQNGARRAGRRRRTGT